MAIAILVACVRAVFSVRYRRIAIGLLLVSCILSLAAWLVSFTRPIHFRWANSTGTVNLLLYGHDGGPLWMARAAARRVLRHELAKRGIPICLHCGYDLRGQTEPRCPECGERI